MKGPIEREGRADRIDGLIWVELIQVPQPLLGKGERRGFVTRSKLDLLCPRTTRDPTEALLEKRAFGRGKFSARASVVRHCLSFPQPLAAPLPDR